MYLFDYARRSVVVLYSHGNKVKTKSADRSLADLGISRLFTCGVNKVSTVLVLFKLTIYCFKNFGRL